MARAERFGQLLRRYRRAAGLTQKGLAARARVSLRTITNLEGSPPARPHGETLRLIAEALGLTADERAQLEQRLTGGAAPAQAARAMLPTYDTAFVGRETDLAALRAISMPAADAALPGGVPPLPHGPRLLTLIGLPGYGKTRLAVALANDVASAYREGARFVDLSGLTDPGGVARAVARAIGLAVCPGLAPLDPLLVALQPQQILLVLDGAEQSLDPCAAFVDTVLRRCPAVQLVVTSREPLRIEGERVWRVAPLGLPDASPRAGTGATRRAALPAIRASAAARLFADRAARVDPGSTISLANAGPLDAICRALGGVPLRIELAAAQVGSLTLSDLAAQLAALPQEQPLAGVIAWSYRCLAPADRALLRTLAPFVGCWPGEAATICERLACGDAASGGLRRLTAAGLVRREHREGIVYYRLPRPVRAYALVQLRVAGEEAAAGAGHLAWCLQLAQGAVDKQLAAADGDFCYALIRALDHDPEGGRRLAAALRASGLAARSGVTSWERLLPLLEQIAPPIFLDAPDPAYESA